MNWTETVLAYCERGSDPSIFAEPLNALTNIAFFIAAILGYRRLTQLRHSDRNIDYLIFCALVGLVGIGSLSFHVFAQRWSGLADVLPIAVFILVYLNFALNRFVGASPGVSFLATVAFALTGPAIAQLPCENGGCLNGSLGYVPALLALFGIGWVIFKRGHPAGTALLTAGGVFTASLALRISDRAVCDLTTVGGHTAGTHFAWHLLNAVVLYLLLRAAIDYGAHGQKTYEVLPPAADTH